MCTFYWANKSRDTGRGGIVESCCHFNEPCADLLWLEVTDDCVDVVEDLINEGHHFSHLHLDEVSSALLGDLDECVAGHVLDTVMGLWSGRGTEHDIMVLCAYVCYVLTINALRSKFNTCWNKKNI